MGSKELNVRGSLICHFFTLVRDRVKGTCILRDFDYSQEANIYLHTPICALHIHYKILQIFF